MSVRLSAALDGWNFFSWSLAKMNRSISFLAHLVFTFGTATGLSGLRDQMSSLVSAARVTSELITSSRKMNRANGCIGNRIRAYAFGKESPIGKDAELFLERTARRNVTASSGCCRC